MISWEERGVDDGAENEEGDLVISAGCQNFLNVFPRPLRRRLLGVGDWEDSGVDGRMSSGARRRSLSIMSTEGLRLGTERLGRVIACIGGIDSI